jgi:hypothetical protein
LKRAIQIIAFLCLSVSGAYAQTCTSGTQITDTIYSPINHTPFSGTVKIDSSVPMTSNGYTLGVDSRTLTVTNGVISSTPFCLEPNDTPTTQGSYYSATFQSSLPPKISWTERWLVPTTGSAVTIAAIRYPQSNNNVPFQVGLLTLKGDILTHVASGAGGYSVLHAGTDGQILSYDSSQINGLKPVTLSINGQSGFTQSFATQNDTNVTIAESSSANTHTFSLGWTGRLAKTRQHSATVYTDQDNTWGPYAMDLGAATSLFVPRSAGAAPTGASNLAFDSTSNTLVYGDGSAKNTVLGYTGSAPTNGHLPLFGAPGNVTDSGGAVTQNSAINLADAKLAAFGDSQTEQNSIAVSGYVSRLRALMGNRYIGNYGVSGQTCAQIQTRFLQAQEKHASDWISIIWAGRNDTGGAADVAGCIDTMVAALPNPKRYIVIGETNGEGEGVSTSNYNWAVNLNATLASRHGSKFLDIRPILVANANLADGADAIDAAADVVPASLRSQTLNTGTLTSTIDASTCSIPLTFGAAPINGVVGSLTINQILHIDNEYIYVLGRTNSTVTSCTRGYGGTTAASHTGGATFIGIDIIHIGDAGHAIIAQQLYNKLQSLYFVTGPNFVTQENLRQLFATPYAIGSVTAAPGRFSHLSVIDGSNPSYGVLPRFPVFQVLNSDLSERFRLDATGLTTLMLGHFSGRYVNQDGNGLDGTLLTCLGNDTCGAANGGMTGSVVTAVGNKSVSNCTTCTNVAVVGENAALLMTSSQRVAAMGPLAVERTTTGNDISGIGYAGAINNTTGSGITFNGSEACLGNIDGNYNTCTGAFALLSNQHGSFNAAYGRNSGSLATGNQLAAFGDSSCATVTSGSQDTCVGASTDVTTGTLSGVTAIGYNTKVAVSNATVIGGTYVGLGLANSSPSHTLDVNNITGGVTSVAVTAGSVQNIDLLDVFANDGTTKYWSISSAGRVTSSVSANLNVVNQGTSTLERFYPNVVSAHGDTAVSGAWIIHTPLARSQNIMFKLRVHGYLWGTASIVDFTVAGYDTSAGTGSLDSAAGSVQSYSLQDTGNDGLAKSVGLDANGNVAVALGATNSSISFGRIAVDAWVTKTSTDYSSSTWSIDQSTTANFGWTDLHALTSALLATTMAANTSVTAPTFTSPASNLVIKPQTGSSNSTTAVQIQTPAGAAVLDVDTTQGGRVGINTTPAFALDILDSLNAGFQIKANSNTTHAYAQVTTGNAPGSGSSQASWRIFDGSTKSGEFLGALANASGSRYVGITAYADRDGNMLPINVFTQDAGGTLRQVAQFGAGQTAGTSATTTLFGPVTSSGLLTLNNGASLGTTTLSGNATFSGNVVFSGNPNFTGTPTFGAVTFSTSVSAPVHKSVGAMGIRPGADSTTAVQIQNAAGTNAVDVDTQNTRLGIGTAGPAYKLDVNGDASVNTLLHLQGTQTAYDMSELHPVLYGSTAGGAGYPFTLTGNLVLQGRANNSLGIDLVTGISSVAAAVFTGSGLNDLTKGGTYTASIAQTYCVQIDATGTPDTFKWGTDPTCTTFSGGTGVAITGAAQTLSSGVTVTFAATTGHTLADHWTIAATPANIAVAALGSGNVQIRGNGTDSNYALDIQKSGSTGTLKVKDQTATTGHTTVLVDLGAADSATTTVLTVKGAAAVGGGSTILYRCTVAGTLRVGQITSVAADCGTAVDTGLRTN